MAKRITIRALILIGILCALTIAIVIFLTITLVRTAELNRAFAEFISSDTASITCTAKQNYYVIKGTQGRTEQEDEKTVSYAYRRNGNGYDMKCYAFTIKDNIIYLGGKKAEISDKDTVDRYENVFVHHKLHEYSNSFPSAERVMMVYDPTEIAETLSKYRFVFTEKRTESTVVEYKLFLGKGFYRYILRNAYAGYDVREIDKSLFDPLIVTLDNGKLKSVSFSVKAHFEDKGKGAFDLNFSREYSCYIEYSDTVDIDVENQNVEDGFYREFIPREVITLGNYYTDVAFYKGKAYCVESPSEFNENTAKTVLKICDLKTGVVETEKVLSEDSDGLVSAIAVKDGYVYLWGRGRAYEYNLITDSVRFINDALVIYIMDTGVNVIINGSQYFGSDFGNLAETSDVVDLIYHAEANRYYKKRIVDDGIYLALVSSNGEIIKDIECKDFSFNSKGVIVTVKNKEYTNGFTQRQLNFDLDIIGNRDDVFVFNNTSARYVDENDGLKFYDRYVYDKNSGERYFIDRSYLFYGNYYIFGENMYFFKGGVLYTSDHYATKTADNKLFV